MTGFDDVEFAGLVLDSERLSLRPWRPADAEAVYSALHDDVDAQRFTSLPVPYTRADAVEFATKIGNSERAARSGVGAALVERDSGRLVGSASLRLEDNGEIGYLIYRQHRGHGYAAEATRALAEWAFARGLPRVYLLCRPTNLASVRTALRAGFRFEGVSRGMRLRPADVRVGTPIVDMARFGRLPEDRPGPVPYAFPPLPPEGVDDGVLRLRTMLPDDAGALAELSNDELTLRWDFTGEPRTARQVEAIADGAGLQWLVGAVAQFAMVDVATGRVAGELRLRKAGPPQIGGLGYTVHPAFRGRGYATRALRLLVPWAFDVLGMARLELGAKVGNEASLRAASVAGFEPDGLRRARLRNRDGSFSDEVRFTLVNPRHR